MLKIQKNGIYTVGRTLKNFWRAIWQILLKVIIYLACDLMIPLPVTYITWRKPFLNLLIETRIFIAVFMWITVKPIGNAHQ